MMVFQVTVVNWDHTVQQCACLPWLYKNLLNVLSLCKILPPVYLISNLFSNGGFGNSNMLLSLEKKWDLRW